jgi:histidine triad (HIT) family protein
MPESSPESSPGPSADPECLFCKIVGGDVPADVVHETETTVAFRDVNPVAPTHVLVVPREHLPNAAAVAESEPALLAGMVNAAAAVAAQEDLDEGYRLVVNTGPAAQQSVFHAHLHVIGGRAMTWPPG